MDSIKLYWDKRFKEKNQIWGEEPSDAAVRAASFLKKQNLKGQKILDVGCGYGRDSAYFASYQHEVTGIDISHEGIKIARNCYPEIDFITGSIFDLPFPDERLKGKVWKFSNDVNTDQIIPSQYLLLPTIAEMKQYTFEPLDPGFASRVCKVCKGDIIVGGENFGSGSSREQAPRVLKELGISAVVAKSFARIFFRNAINIGLPVLVCGDVYDNVAAGECLEIDVLQGRIINLDRQIEFSSTKLPEHIMKILTANGLIDYLNEREGRLQ